MSIPAHIFRGIKLAAAKLSPSSPTTEGEILAVIRDAILSEAPAPIADPDPVPEPFDPEGGSAFPDACDYGMSMRDYFAGQVLGSVRLSGADIDPATCDLSGYVHVAGHCYALADAMIRARAVKS